MKASQPAPQSSALIGLAFDADDGQTRVTKGDNFVLWGGSKDTHSFMQETTVKINEKLDTRGKRLDDVSVREFHDICREVVDSIGKP